MPLTSHRVVMQHEVHWLLHRITGLLMLLVDMQFTHFTNAFFTFTVSHGFTINVYL